MNAEVPDKAKECSLSSFERNRYFDGKWLTARDFEAEQRYFISKERTEHRLLHGSGIVYGLTVSNLKVHVEAKELQFDLSNGYALDCCGRGIVVPKEEKGRKETVKEGLEAATPYYLYLEYAEAPREPTETTGVAATSGGPECQYGRVYEGYKVSVSTNPPVADCATARVLLGVVSHNTAAGQWIITQVDRPVVYSNPALFGKLSEHAEDKRNPHETTAEQVGALVSVNGVSSPGDNIDLIGEGAVTISPKVGAKKITLRVNALTSINGIAGTEGDLVIVSEDQSIEVGTTENGTMINLKAKTPERQIWPVISDINWTNGGILQPEDFIERGLTVTFSERMHPDTITLDTFVVTIELPEGDGDGNLIGYRPLIVHGSVVSDKAEDDTQWRFTPAGELVTWISRHLKVLPPEPGLRVRATLKGNAILDAAGERPLDGDVVVKTGEPKGLSLPSGDDCRGGDFESWFYLTVPKSVEGAAQGSDATRSQGSGEALANEGAAQESDFTRIRGVGEALDGRLKAAGVLTFVDLAAKSPEEISRILGLGWSIERINKARLIEHAQQLAREV